MPVKLDAVRIHGYEAIESLILVSLVTADPLLLIGKCGTGKTLMPNSRSGGFGLKRRNDNANFWPVVPFPRAAKSVFAASYSKI